jgi:uncharacterized phage-like protein YoqJ
MRIAITGHRPNKLGNDYDLKSDLIHRIKGEILDQLWMIDKDFDLTLISGMALGIDTLFANIAIEGNMKLICAIPCIGQESRWPQKSKDKYNEILSKAYEIVRVTTDEYTHSCMQKRNKWMVNNCDILIAVWDGTPGGTANCVNYAMDVGKHIIRIDPHNLREI